MYMSIRTLDYVIFSHQANLSKTTKHWDSFVSHCISDENTSQYNHGPFPRDGGFRYEFQFDAIELHLLPGCDITKENAFVFVDYVVKTSQLSYPRDKGFVHLSIPLETIVPHLPIKIANLHHMQLGTHLPKSEIIRSFNSHSCASCDLYHSIFTVVDSKSSKAKNCMRALRLNANKKSEILETKAQVLLPPDPM